MKPSVLITGASSGIGQKTAIYFSNKGHHVHLVGRNETRLSETQKLCKGTTTVHLCNLESASESNMLCEKIITDNFHPPCLILVNNAGIFERHSQENGTDDIWTKQFEVNLLSPVRLTRNFLPYWKSQGKGSVVNISSTLGLKPSFNVASYSAIKAALINWTQSLALEEGRWGIRANVICPGIVDTPIHDFHHQGASEKEKAIESMRKLQPLNRIGQPEEIASAIYFLATEESSWTTGAVLSIDGGINLT